ncbi:MAG TPA: hypothetical protein VF384_01795 [Planctomycetota bacterium]
MNLRALSPDGPQEGAPARFLWQAREVAPPFTVVLLDAGYRKLAAFGGITSACFVPDASLLGRLASGSTFHWHVSAQVDGVVCRSPLASFEIR